MFIISENYIQILETCLKDYEEQLHMIPELYTKVMESEDENEMTEELNRIDQKRKELQSAIKKVKQQLKELTIKQHEMDDNKPNESDKVTGAAPDSTNSSRQVKWVKEVDTGELYPMEVTSEPEIPGHLTVSPIVSTSENDMQEPVYGSVNTPCEEVLTAIRIMNTHK